MPPKIIEKISGKTAGYKMLKTNRVGDHIWWITDNSKFEKDYPRWKIKYNLENSLQKMIKFEINK